MTEHIKAAAAQIREMQRAPGNEALDSQKALLDMAWNSALEAAAAIVEAMKLPGNNKFERLFPTDRDGFMDEGETV